MTMKVRTDRRKHAKLGDNIFIYGNEGTCNDYARVVRVTSEGVYVSNGNMPYLGTLCYDFIKHGDYRAPRKHPNYNHRKSNATLAAYLRMMARCGEVEPRADALREAAARLEGLK
jgi:hypothetical protein